MLTPESYENLNQASELSRVELRTCYGTLNHRLAAAKFGKTELVIRQGGNHSYDRYAGELPAIEAFLLSRIAESVR